MIICFDLLSCTFRMVGLKVANNKSSANIFSPVILLNKEDFPALV